MPITKKEATKIVNLDLTGLRGEKRLEAIRRAGEIIVEEINKELDASRTPVHGGAFKKSLSKDYAKKKGDNTSDLFLSGDMRSQITFQEHRKGVKVGIFDPEEAVKAHGHHKDTRGILPKRQFIPEPGESFKDKILRKVSKEIDRIRDAGES